MTIIFEIRRRTKAALAPFLLILVIIYFGISFVEGKRGVIAWVSLTQKNKVAENQLYILKSKRDESEKVSQGLRYSSLDLDLLDEQARKKLGFSHPNDFIVYTNNH